MIDRDRRENGEKLSIAWIHHQKDFDSITRSWQILTLNINRIASLLPSFSSKTMAIFNTDLNLSTGAITIQDIKLNNGYD